jgi:hypothetical protein
MDGPADDLLESTMAKIRSMNAALDSTIEGLDEKLSLVLKKQEHDYLKGYSIYVKQKE